VKSVVGVAKRMGRHDDERQKHGSDNEDKRSDRKRRHEKSLRKHDDRKSRKRDRDDSRRRRSHSSDGSSSSSGRDQKRGKKEKKHHKKSERKKHKNPHKEERKKSKEQNESDGEAASRLERNYSFAGSLHALLELQPSMASELPILLIRMADGASFNVSQMPDARVSIRLQNVLASLSPFGVEKDEMGSWMWKAPAGGNRNKDPLLLLKIARTLLDQIGITMEAVENYRKHEDAVPAGSISNDKEIQKGEDVLSAMTGLILEQFEKGTDSDSPSLAQELGSLCNMILSGENIALDGLPDEALRVGIEQLFRAAGLEKSEIEESDDDDDDEPGDEEPAMGYGLPDEDESHAAANMKLILEACKANDGKAKAKRPFEGPTLIPSKELATQHMDENDDDEDDEEEGPAPIGSEKARRRVRKGPTLPPEVVKAMADRRKRELDGVATEMEIQLGGIDEREQWMLEPGEHEFLQGIKSGKTPIKSRNFRNTKQSSAVEVVVPVHPAVQAEMDAIMDLHREARGPSLIEQHRLKKAEEKAEAEKGGKAGWKWSRDKDLDDGRRVDKNNLNMIMGGAASNLKDKFQGGFNR
jgi:hypothetical protein